MSNIKLYFTILILLFIIQSCEKEEINPDKLVLPEITTSGKRTFGAIVNGKIWTANGGSVCFLCSPNPYARVDYTPSPNDRPSIMYLGASNSYNEILNESIGLVFNITDNLKVGEKIELNKSNIFSRISFYDELNKCSVISDDSTNGYIEIKRLDLENGIVSGIFEADLIDDCDTIYIKQGRFDLVFSTR
ncbi:MAG: hypothetical protein WAO74_01930 [Polaribacter sp.]|uniref:hypothetical protein n=1 Tax=Polaribacter sp. TaxID=1920175 RepID=UPI003BB00017